jgi:tetratricopeptide (TPR) repeat protein
LSGEDGTGEDGRGWVRSAGAQDQARKAAARQVRKAPEAICERKPGTRCPNNSFDSLAPGVYLYGRAAMGKRIILLLLLLRPTLSRARDKPETWLQIRSQHFIVATNANEKAGRRIADQFERMRSVFHTVFPKLSIDTSSPIIVLAIKDEKDFRALEPEVYLTKGQLKLAGLFVRAPDKNYVLMRVDAQGEHPYAVVYHEYTHLLLSKAAEWMPLWLNEGLAEFYENTDIHDADVALGQPSPGHLQLLRENHLLPLPTLFAVDNNSPYYHEENKGSIFYAESWALTHYLYIKDRKEKTQSINDYLELLRKKIDPLTAATRAFGDLRQLETDLNNYIGLASFSYFKLSTPTAVDDAAFQVQPLTEIQADALRADFLACNDRIADARLVLDRMLLQDPQNVSALETMGFLELRAGHLDQARNRYEQAVKLDSQSYLANYYFAAISMQAGAGPADDAQVESSLRAAVKLNPWFAPPFERLAAFLGMRHRSLDEAHGLAIVAVQLDPGNASYRVTAANVLLQMQRGKDAVTVLREALKVAKSPEETSMIENFLEHAEQSMMAGERQAQQNRDRAQELQADIESNAKSAAASDVHTVVLEEAIPKGPHQFLSGTLKNVHCQGAGIDMTLDAKGKTVLLHGGNYARIAFSALGFTPKGDLSPCTDLEGRLAKVEYVGSASNPASAYVTAIELHK